MTTPGLLAAPKDLTICSKGDFAHSVISATFENQVLKAPHATALTLEGKSLSYGELNARANQLAAYLRELGVGPESLVGVHLDRSFDLVVAIFAILKAGGAYLPLDLACPEDRLTFMLEDSHSKVLLTHSDFTGRFVPYKGAVVCLDRDAEGLPRDAGQCRAAFHFDRRVVSFWVTGCLDAFSLERLRFFGLGNFWCAALWRTVGDRALHGQPLRLRFS